jgi:folylpolyglutamate synthase/dihydropteroate synthase
MGTIIEPQDSARADLARGAQSVSQGNSGHTKDWEKQRNERSARLEAGSHHASGKVARAECKALFEAVIRPAIGSALRATTEAGRFSRGSSGERRPAADP